MGPTSITSQVQNYNRNIQRIFSSQIYQLDFSTTPRLPIFKNTYQGLPLPNMIRLCGHEPPPPGILKQLSSFGSRYLAALRDNLNTRFDYSEDKSKKPTMSGPSTFAFIFEGVLLLPGKINLWYV